MKTYRIEFKKKSAGGASLHQTVEEEEAPHLERVSDNAATLYFESGIVNIREVQPETSASI